MIYTESRVDLTPRCLIVVRLKELRKISDNQGGYYGNLLIGVRQLWEQRARNKRLPALAGQVQSRLTGSRHQRAGNS